MVLLVLAAGAVLRFAVWIGVAAAAVGLLIALWEFIGWLDRRLCASEQRKLRAQARREEIARRADEQNALALAGDPRGMYGDYPPARS